MTTDRYWDAVKLLISNDGVDAATDFTDISESGHVITPSGNAEKDAILPRYGETSAKLRGVGDILTIPDSADFHFGSGAFTIEFDFRLFSDSGSFNMTLLGQWDSAGNERAWRFMYQEAIGNFMYFYWSPTGTVGTHEVKAIFDANQAEWYHVAIVREVSGLFTMYIAGIPLATNDKDPDLYPLRDSTADVIVGDEQAGGQPALCNLANVRITKGLARYTNNFVPVFGEHPMSLAPPEGNPTGLFPSAV